MEEKLVGILKEKRMTVSTAESCTGGLIAAKIINAAGASAVYNEGYITYANEAKEKILGVKHKTLESFGAVSEETVIEMALGCRKASGSDVALVSSGIAGPEGGTEEKPVGLVYLACAVGNNVKVEKNIFSGNRQEIRNQAAEKALELAIDMINR